MAREPMKLSQHVRALQKLLKEYGDMDVVYSVDDEGNAFRKIWWSPSLGYYCERDSEYISEENFREEFEDMEYYSMDDFEKVVCVN